MTGIGGTILRLIFWFCFCATVYTYFLYPLLLMVLSRLSPWRRRLKASTQCTPASNEDLPHITMVISAYNEQTTLPDKIANCQELEYPCDKISFLIGSDGSTDGTLRILRKIDDPRFRTLHSRMRRGKVQMLNRLMKLVTSEIVVFSDANTIYRSDAIRQLVKLFQAKKVGVVIGKLELSVPAQDADACCTESLYWRYENRIKQWESDLGAVPTINGGIFAIRRELFQKLPPNAITEDQVLGMKIMTSGYRCLFAKDARAYESVSSWKGELQRRIRISAGNFQSLFLVPSILHPRQGWVGFAFVSHKLLRWLVPLFLVGMFSANFLLAGEFFYGSTLFLQGLFYASGLVGVLLPKLTGFLKVLSVPKYFLAMNAAILIGLGRFLTGRQRTTWAKASRL
jgi:cellulose synthase/poly-beta-1,6-N-acetylglucosamine synthase-like glycosyltransferase